MLQDLTSVDYQLNGCVVRVMATNINKTVKGSIEHTKYMQRIVCESQRKRFHECGSSKILNLSLWEL